MFVFDQTFRLVRRMIISVQSRDNQTSGGQKGRFSRDIFFQSKSSQWLKVQFRVSICRIIFPLFFNSVIEIHILFAPILNKSCTVSKSRFVPMLVFRWASVAPFTPFSLIEPLFISLTFFISTLRQDSSAPPLTQELYAFRHISIFLCRSFCLKFSAS